MKKRGGSKMEPKENAVFMTSPKSDDRSSSIDTCVATPCEDSSLAADDEEVAKPLKEPLKAYYSKDLRREVYRLKLTIKRKGPGANDHKTGYMALLREHWKANPPVAPTDEKPPKEPEEDQRRKGLRLLLPRAEPQETPESDEASSASSSELSSCLSLNAEHEMAADAEDLEDMGPDLSLFDDEMVHNEVDHSEAKVEKVASACSSVDNRKVGGVVFTTSPHTLCSENTCEEFKIDVSSRYLPPCVVDASQESSDDLHGSQSTQGIRMHTVYWERRLVVSKRRIAELYGELQGSLAQDEADLLHDELAYYMRERKRALTALLSDTSIN